MGFYDKFEILCKENGVTPTRIAREIGIAQQSVSLWKRRGSIPSGENLQKLADYFGVTVDYLLSNEPKEKTATEIGDGRSEYDARVLAWFHSLPPEKRAAILEIGDGPKE